MLSLGYKVVRNVFAATSERSFVSWTVVLEGVPSWTVVWWVLLSWKVLIMEYC